MADDKYARLMPFNPRMGYHIQGYVYREYAFRGGERPTWYQVPAELAEELAALQQDAGNPRSQPLFEIVSKDTKERTERGENEKYLAALGAVTATVSLPKQFAQPGTVDLSGNAPSVPPITARADDRAAALPTPRMAARKTAKAERSPAGAITTGDIASDVAPSDDEMK